MLSINYLLAINKTESSIRTHKSGIRVLFDGVVHCQHMPNIPSDYSTISPKTMRIAMKSPTPNSLSFLRKYDEDSRISMTSHIQSLK